MGYFPFGWYVQIEQNCLNVKGNENEFKVLCNWKLKKTTTGQGQSKIPWIFFYPIVHYISGVLWDGHNLNVV